LQGTEQLTRDAWLLSNGDVLTWNAVTNQWEAQAVPGDNWGTQVAVVNAPLTGNGTAANPLGLNY
jgi:hypothetical protein